MALSGTGKVSYNNLVVTVIILSVLAIFMTYLYVIGRSRTLDYVETNVTLTYSNKSSFGNSSDITDDYTIEVVLVCDKEWGDKFEHNMEEILKYWTTYFWHLSIRFKTLRSSNISFRVNKIIVIPSLAEQPFIEDARDEEGGTSLSTVLSLFSVWIWDQKETLPKFDIAILVTSTKYIHNTNGMGYIAGACRHRWGSIIYADYGYYSSVNTAAHEIGHNLGSPHDEYYPDGCNATGYIMGPQGGNGFTRCHFSECSDRAISTYISSQQAECLKRVDEPGNPVIQPNYSAILTLTMQEQCIRSRGENAEMGYGNCSHVQCWLNNGYTVFSPNDNTPCFQTGRCFRGVCLSSTSFLTNRKTGDCLLGTDRFSGIDKATVAKCPLLASPLDQFRTTRVETGYWLRIQYSTGDTMGDKSKCLQAPNENGGIVGFARCSTEGRMEWDLVALKFGEYLLIETSTGRCVKQEDNHAVAVDCGDRKDRSMIWKITGIIE